MTMTLFFWNSKRNSTGSYIKVAQAPGKGSAQYSVVMSYGEAQKADTLFSVKDSDGSQFITFAPGKRP